MNVNPLLLVLLACLYLAPTIIAYARRVKRMDDLIMWNAAFGFLPPVWIATLIIAITDQEK